MKPSINLSIGYLNIWGIHDKVHGCKLDVLKKYLKGDIEIPNKYKWKDDYANIFIETLNSEVIKCIIFEAGQRLRSGIN